MPYQNLNSEIMLALAIWLLAISIFAVMLVLAVAQIISENQPKIDISQKSSSKRRNHLVQIAVDVFRRKR